MSEDVRPVNTSSPKFAEGVEAGLNSPEDTKNWHAGNELGQELKDEYVKTPLVSESPHSLGNPSQPLFLRDRSDGKEDQDEKETQE